MWRVGTTPNVGDEAFFFFFKVFRRRGLRVNADESKVMVIGGEEGL